MAAVEREARRLVGCRSRHDGRGGAGPRIDGVDVAVGGIGDQAVARRPERRRDALLAADVDGGGGEEQEKDHDRQGDGPPWQAWHQDRLTNDVNHREPPFGERPGRPLPDGGAGGQDVIDVIGI